MTSCAPFHHHQWMERSQVQGHCSIQPSRKFWLLFNPNLTVFRKKGRINHHPIYHKILYIQVTFLLQLGISIGKSGISEPSSDHKFLESQKLQSSFLSIARAFICNQNPYFLILWFLLLWISPPTYPSPQKRTEQKSP